MIINAVEKELPRRGAVRWAKGANALSAFEWRGRVRYRETGRLRYRPASEWRAEYPLANHPDDEVESFANRSLDFARFRGFRAPVGQTQSQLCPV